MADLAGSAAATGARPKVDTDIHARIGHQLKALYDDVVEQPVPDRFADLLMRLEMQSSPESDREQG